MNNLLKNEALPIRLEVNSYYYYFCYNTLLTYVQVNVVDSRSLILIVQ